MPSALTRQNEQGGPGCCPMPVRGVRPRHVVHVLLWLITTRKRSPTAIATRAVLGTVAVVQGRRSGGHMRGATEVDQGSARIAGAGTRGRRRYAVSAQHEHRPTRELALDGERLPSNRRLRTWRRRRTRRYVTDTELLRSYRGLQARIETTGKRPRLTAALVSVLERWLDARSVTRAPHNTSNACSPNSASRSTAFSSIRRRPLTCPDKYRGGEGHRCIAGQGTGIAHRKHARAHAV
jgi:hypothetical protein